MDEKEFKQISHFLGNEKLIGQINDRNFKAKIGKYYLKNNKLFRKCKNGNRRVIPRYELEPAMYLLYDEPLSAHFGIEKCYEKAKSRFY